MHILVVLDDRIVMVHKTIAVVLITKLVLDGSSDNSCSLVEQESTE